MSEKPKRKTTPISGSDSFVPNTNKNIPRKKTITYSLTIYDTPTIEENYAVQAIVNTLQYNILQALQVTTIVEARGEYTVKHSDDISQLLQYRDTLLDYGLLADVNEHISFI